MAVKTNMRNSQVGACYLGILPVSSIEGLYSRRMSSVCTPSCSSDRSWQPWPLQEMQVGQFLFFNVCIWGLEVWRDRCFCVKLLNTYSRRNRWPGRVLSLTGQRHSMKRRWQTFGKRRRVASKVSFSLRLDKQRCHDSTAISSYPSDAVELWLSTKAVSK